MFPLDKRFVQVYMTLNAIKPKNPTTEEAILFQQFQDTLEFLRQDLGTYFKEQNALIGQIMQLTKELQTEWEVI